MIDVAHRVQNMRRMQWFFRGSVLLYVAAGLLIPKALELHGGLFNLPLSTYLIVASLVGIGAIVSLGLITIWLPARLTAPDRLVQRPGVNRVSAVVMELQRAFMIGMSGAHAVAVAGLFLFLLNGYARDLFIFAALSLAGLSLNTPTEASWRQIIDEVRERRADWSNAW